ncbi:hypothetical protein [Shewanella waksmanii]|uniref:hypothetical protein n=1 Tax=Shewanella waksmanii TaxID=213783 RepID=UPI0004B9E20F|nr:hypothetical protein [Shewanella waksmanii]
MIRTLKLLHWLGLLMLTAGVGCYLMTEMAQQVSGMVTIASLIGLGLVAMSPFPVVLFIQWAKAQPTHTDSPRDNKD